MALVNNAILGEVSGKMGNKVFRRMNGKTFVSERPQNYKPAKTPEARKVRSSFGMSVLLAKKLITESELKEIWSAARIEGSNSYHRIIIHNSKQIYDGSLTARSKITPDGLFLSIDSAALENEVLHLVLNCPAENNLDFPASLFLLYYSGKTNTPLVITRTEIQESNSGGIYELDINPAKSTVKALNEDPDAMLFTTIVSETVRKKKPYWTSTASSKIG